MLIIYLIKDLINASPSFILVIFLKNFLFFNFIKKYNNLLYILNNYI